MYFGWVGLLWRLKDSEGCKGRGGRIAATSQYQSIYKRSPLCATLPPRVPTPPLQTSGPDARTYKCACARLGRVWHLSRSIIPPRSVAAYRRTESGRMQRFWKRTPRKATCNAMLKEALLLQAGVAHVCSYLWRRGRRKTGRIRLPSVNHTGRSEKGEREEGSAVSHINCCWSREEKKNPLWQEYLQCMWAWACWKSWWKESGLVKAG